MRRHLVCIRHHHEEHRGRMRGGVPRWGRRGRRRAIGLVSALLACLFLASCTAPDSFAPITREGDAVNSLFILALALSAFVFLLVVGILTFNMIKFHDHGQEASQTAGNYKLEATWTLLPFLLLVALFILSVRAENVINDPGPTPPLVVNVIGHQWWWEFQYPSLGITTANELHVPVGTPLELKLHTVDVIHSFWVPKFGWKMDAFPDKINTMRVFIKNNDAGTYLGTCTEYCGVEHAWMRIKVFAQNQNNFNAWVKDQKAPPPTNLSSIEARGIGVFVTYTCVNCHTVTGLSKGTIGPDLSHVGSRTTLGAGVLTNTPANMEEWISNVQQVKPDALMPSFNQIPKSDLKALVAYLEGLK